MKTIRPVNEIKLPGNVIQASMMAAYLLVFLISLTTVEALYKSLDNDSTLFWASESMVPGDPLHSYSKSKAFCESLAGNMATGNPADMNILNSFLPLASYPYWLGQGDYIGTWADGSPIATDVEADHPECLSNCGIHYQGGKLVRMSMDEDRGANVVCKVAVDGMFFIRLMTSRKILLSSDQHEVVLAAQFARAFLQNGFYIGVSFMVMIISSFVVILDIIKRCSRAFLSSPRLKQVPQESDEEESQPLEGTTS